VDIGKLFRDGWGLFTKDLGPLIVGMLIACIIPAVAMSIVVAVTIGASLGGITTNAQGEVTSVDTGSVVVWIVGTVIIVVVAVFLTVPLFAGLLEGVLLRIRQGRAMAYGDSFNGFRLFGRVVWAAVLLGIIYAALMLVPTGIIVAGGVTSSAAVVVLGVVLLLVALVLYVYLFVRWLYVFPVIVDRGVGVGEALTQSAALVRGRWWWTLLGYFVLSVVVGAVSSVLGFIPFVGAVVTIVLYPFVLTYIVAMYFQARGEGGLIDTVTGYVAPSSFGGPPAYSQQATPYVSPGAPPIAPPPPAAPAPGPGWVPPAAGAAWGPPAAAPDPSASPAVPQAYAPAPPPPFAPPAPGQAAPAMPGAPAAPEPPEPPAPPAGP